MRGERYHRYELLQRLATSGLAEVFLAREVAGGDAQRLVVVKRIQEKPAADPAHARRLIDEVQTVTTLDHPNIAKVYEVGRYQGACFFSMERLVGWDLCQIQHRLTVLGRMLPVWAVIELVGAAARGLDAAHRARANGQPLDLVHRDINPRSLFVTVDGILKILDFGVAGFGVQPHDRTEQGYLRGRMSYLSPEQLTGEEVDGRSDIYALGVVLHELLCGRRLFEVKSANEIRAAMERPIPPPQRRPEMLSEELVRATMRALERDRAMRYPTAADLARELAASQPFATAVLPTERLAGYFAALEREETGTHRMGRCTAVTRWLDDDVAVPTRVPRHRKIAGWLRTRLTGRMQGD